MVNMRPDSPGSAGAAAMSPEDDYENFAQLTNVRKSSGEEDEDYQNFADDSTGDLAVGRCNTTDNANGGRVHVEQEKKMRREIANCNERRRMQSINAGFLALRALLPRRDGEKMSKASILQQTSDMITSLQAEKMQLIHEKMQIKRSLEQQCGGVDNSSSSSSAASPLNNCDDARVPSTKPHIMAPPKKRRKYVDDAAVATASAESSDEGVGMMSDDTDMLKASSSSPKPDASTGDSSCGDKSWEIELIQRQLIEIRLAFDRERRLRLLYEEELRKRDINNLRGSMGHIRVSTLLNTANTASPLGPTAQLVSVAPSSLKHTVESLVTLNGCALSPSPASTNDSPSLVSNSAYFASPTVVSTAPATVVAQSSKQSLEAIVEAIRHLEGDQLFIDTEPHSKNDIARMDTSNGLVPSSY